jgi:glucose-1-phosphate cytidylyltransferase
MKVVILAGGLGTRLSEVTGSIPKPMVRIGGKPIIWHIMNHYAKYGFNDFVVALGYKAEVIREYFFNFNSLNSDFTVDLATGSVSWINSTAPDWKVTLVDTGVETLTGTRIKKLKNVIGENRFMLTYGDGVADVDIQSLLDFHVGHGKLASMTAVRPVARFGELEIENGLVTSFEEKPQLHGGWINGGFFVFEPAFFDLIPENNVMLEREPLNDATASGQVMAFQHEGFWQCMDTKRDMDNLQAFWDSGKAPWA